MARSSPCDKALSTTVSPWTSSIYSTSREVRKAWRAITLRWSVRPFRPTTRICFELCGRWWVISCCTETSFAMQMSWELFAGQRKRMAYAKCRFPSLFEVTIDIMVRGTRAYPYSVFLKACWHGWWIIFLAICRYLPLTPGRRDPLTKHHHLIKRCGLRPLRSSMYAYIFA